MAAERFLCCKILPLDKGVRAMEFIGLTIDQVALSVEVVGYGMAAIRCLCIGLRCRINPSSPTSVKLL